MSLASLTFPRSLYDSCIAEADRMHPLETGGLLLGHNTGSHFEVRHVIGPGPGARHRRTWFEGDHNWQNEKMAALYRDSGNTLNYLGDWHTHPGATHGHLSSADRRAMRKIICCPGSRLPQPLMGIFFGTPKHWELDLWRGQETRRWFHLAAVAVDRQPYQIY